MGVKFTKSVFPAKEIRILVLGLEGAGKTTVLRKLKVGEIVTTIPTPGFSLETVEYRNLVFNAWDVGGQNKDRSLWSHYLQGTQGVIFVVDSNDEARISEAHDELSRLFNEDELRETYILVIANKQDLPNAMSVADITDRLQLQSRKPRSWDFGDQLGLPYDKVRPWRIQACCATTGQGLDEGMEWFTKVVLDDSDS
ncbi:hypothetical protein BGZ99_008455 [Dissophora globulifera]|uniref:ADP-ribosylation factor n=1 Tax=Dissophora globulifera TaxID=979702 RepID=A0A9P6UPD7_9FUNG|nr:hypothetical protein BGZ99_008455 [Dissophora globulifera]